jgi:hypothetical protein
MFTFIEKGIEIVETKEICKDIYDNIKIKYLVKILREIERDVYIKRLVSKDATASCYQHLIKAVGPKNEEGLM